jgi:hypothetical protein
MSNKMKATRLLRKYDKMRAEMRDLEHELARACVAYGREQGYLYGFNKDHLRMQLDHEDSRKEKAA